MAYQIRSSGDPVPIGERTTILTRPLGFESFVVGVTDSDLAGVFASASFVRVEGLQRGSWSSVSNYAVGDVVTINDFAYICKIAHNAQVSFDPDQWTKIEVYYKQELDELLAFQDYGLITSSPNSFDDYGALA